MIIKYLDIKQTLNCGLLVVALCFLGLAGLHAQDNQREMALEIKKIFDQELSDSKAYAWLHALSEDVGGRLSGSPGAAAGVEYTRQELVKLGLDSVWLQPCIVPRWERGDIEVVRILNSAYEGTIDLACTSLGNSTGGPGVAAEVIEVQSLEEVEALGEKVAGKIVFYNRPMNPKHYRVFRAYGGAVDQRGRGPRLASRYGAVGCLVRSMTTNIDDVPHTGMTVFNEEDRTIPAMAISTMAAEKLSAILKKEKVRVYMENNSRMLDPVLSHNVIGEIKGSSHPDEIILVGGHLDSWDLGGGAHDDGAGCVQSMEVMNLIKNMNYTPKRTIRCVLFMNEENGLSGGRKYAEVANKKGEFHLAAIESDAGGFSPRGFRCDAHEDVFKPNYRKISAWSPLLEPYGLGLRTGGSGADIGPLKSQKGMLFGLEVDSQRYFDFHHTKNDRIQFVNKRELELGAASMMALVYLLDQNGL